MSVSVGSQSWVCMGPSILAAWQSFPTNMDNFNLAVNTHVDPRRAEAVPVGADRQLLVDDFFLAMGRGHEQYPRNIAWTLGSVDKHGSPLFEGQEPWEDELGLVDRAEGRGALPHVVQLRTTRRRAAACS